MTDRLRRCAAALALALVSCDGPSGATGTASAGSSAPVGSVQLAASAPIAPGPSASARPHSPGAAGADDIYYLVSLSLDEKQALLAEVGGPPNVIHHRIVEVDGGRLVVDLPLRSLSALPLETIDDGGATRRSVDDLLKDKGIAQDLVKASEVLRGFPLGAGGRVAASSAGIIAFNAGDWIYAAETDGTPKRRVAEQASYAPWFSPDAESLLYRRLNGSLDGVEGKYELFAGPADLSQPGRELPDTAALRDGFALSADRKAVRVVVSYEPVVKTCIVRVELTRPFETKKEACLKDGEPLLDGRLSPTGAFAVLFTEKELAEDDPGSTMVLPNGNRRLLKKRAYRMRVVDVEKGAVVTDVPRPMGTFVAVSDSGDTLFVAKDRLVRRRVRGAEPTELDENVGFFVSGRFRGPNELVYVRGDTVQVLDLEKAAWSPLK